MLQHGSRDVVWANGVLAVLLPEELLHCRLFNDKGRREWCGRIRRRSCDRSRVLTVEMVVKLIQVVWKLRVVTRGGRTLFLVASDGLHSLLDGTSVVRLEQVLEFPPILDLGTRNGFLHLVLGFLVKRSVTTLVRVFFRLQFHLQTPREPCLVRRRRKTKRRK